MKKLQICFYGAYDPNYTSNRILMDGLRQNNVRVVEVNANVKMTRLDRDEDMSWWKLIVRVLRKYRLITETIKHIDAIRNSDAIYIGFPGHVETFPAFLIGKIFRKPVVFNPLVVFYTGYVDDQGILKRGSILANLIKFAEKITYTLPDIVLADTPHQKDHLVKEFDIPSEKIYSLPIGADNKVYPYSPKKHTDGLFNVMYYGLYTPLHGVEHIVKAALMLREEKDIVFTMVGKGHTFEENYNRAQDLKLQNMRFYPDMTEDTALATLSEADVFLGFLQKHATVDRVIPNKVYQGLALGKTVISADAKVIGSVFTHRKNIYLCKPSSGKSLANAIVALHKDKHLCSQIAKNGHLIYEKLFTPKMVAWQMMEIIARSQQSL